MNAKWLYWGASVGSVLLRAVPASGATDQSPPAPQLEPGTPWVAILYTLVGLAGISVVGFKNSKRTHLD